MWTPAAQNMSHCQSPDSNMQVNHTHHSPRLDVNYKHLTLTQAQHQLSVLMRLNRRGWSGGVKSSNRLCFEVHSGKYLVLSLVSWWRCFVWTSPEPLLVWSDTATAVWRGERSAGETWESEPRHKTLVMQTNYHLNSGGTYTAKI